MWGGGEHAAAAAGTMPTMAELAACKRERTGAARCCALIPASAHSHTSTPAPSSTQQHAHLAYQVQHRNLQYVPPVSHAVNLLEQVAHSLVLGMVCQHHKRVAPRAQVLHTGAETCQEVGGREWSVSDSKVLSSTR